MSGISAWLLGIAGVVILSVLAELILPEGQMNKYIKVMFSFVILLVIISPLPSLLGMEFSFESIFEGSSTELQEDYLYQLNLDKLTAVSEDLSASIEEVGLKNVQISINANILSDNLEIKSIYVDLSEIEYDQNFVSKNIVSAKTTITEIISQFSLLQNVEVNFSE